MPKGSRPNFEMHSLSPSEGIELGQGQIDEWKESPGRSPG